MFAFEIIDIDDASGSCKKCKDKALNKDWILNEPAYTWHIFYGLYRQCFFVVIV